MPISCKRLEKSGYILTFYLMQQGDDLLCEGPRVHRRLPEGSRMLQHGEEVEALSTHVDQIERQLPFRGIA